MKLDVKHVSALGQVSRHRTLGMIVTCLPVLLGTASCRKQSSPPDINDCTRLEVQHQPSALNYFFPGTTMESVLSSAEKEYVESFNTFTITDPQRIGAFGADVSQGVYAGVLRGFMAHARPIRVLCYRDDKCLASLTLYSNTLVNDDGRMFRYASGLPNKTILEPAEINPLKLRASCALNMTRMYISRVFYPKYVQGYPEPNAWCDAIVRLWKNSYETTERGVTQRSRPDEWIAEAFLCPSVREHVSSGTIYHEPNGPNSSSEAFQSSYAMNPDCEPNSPPDTVLLFETKAGWNQHGGPDLFTFDNHDPKGGCVLFNNGTIKFIRTKEELAQLRWKP